MEIYNLEHDIKVFCVTAKSFPEGIMKAYDTLDSYVEFSTKRNTFGLSRPDKEGNIIYKASADEVIEGEYSKHGLEEFIIKKGKYISILIHDFMNNIPAIKQAFMELIKHPDIDPNGYCLEWVLQGKDVRCMVGMRE